MSDLTRRPSGRLTRRQREKRAYRLVLATGSSAIATVVFLVLSVVGAASFGWVLLLAVLTAVFGFMLRRSLS